MDSGHLKSKRSKPTRPTRKRGVRDAGMVAHQDAMMLDFRVRGTSADEGVSMPSSSSDRVYLKRSTRIEPLACRWWAWPHLVAPVQQAMNIAFRQLPLLRSFIEDSAMHALASEDPRLLGGPYVNLRSTDVPAVKMLLDSTESKSGHLIRLAEDVRILDRKLLRDAKGFSVERWYAELPASLAGVVEMSYDLNNRPSFRVFEELLYDSGMNQATQEVAFSSMKDEQRDFFLNTPRLDGSDRIVAPIAFNHSFFDVISESRLRPVDLGHFIDTLKIPAHHHEHFRRFFTRACLRPRADTRRLHSGGSLSRVGRSE
jgi:hypothetical protein